MKIIIPTFRRPNTQMTLLGLPRAWYSRVVFVCDELDRSTLRIKYPWASILLHPPEINSIAKKRAWIINYYADQDAARKIVMMDDDLRFACRRPGHGTKLFPATPEEMDNHLQWLEGQLDEHVHAGFSARQGNNRLEGDYYRNGRMMYVLGYRPKEMQRLCDLGRIETREDFDYTLQLLKRGFPNIVSTTITVDQRYNAPGGASLERSVESSNADAHKLAELHPGIVKVVNKEYVGSVPRKEVVVQWKKAFELSQERGCISPRTSTES